MNPHVIRLQQSDKNTTKSEEKDGKSKDSSKEEENKTIYNCSKLENSEPEMSDYDRLSRNFYFFNKGFKGHELARNFSNCGTTSIYWYHYETQTYGVKMRYGDFGESTFNSTLFIQNTT